MSLVQLAKWTATAALLGALGCGSAGMSPGHDAGADAGTGGAGMGGAGTTSSSSSGMLGGGNGYPWCTGQCAIGPPDGWDYPVLLWFGAEQDFPGCPDEAPLLSYEGHADLEAPFDCGTCSCSPSTGSCGLPTTMTANAATCAQNGAATPHTPFDPSSGWNGACDSNDAIPSGKLCSGVKCVQSLTVGPLSVNDGGCTPSKPPTPSPPVWKTYVHGCKKVPPVPCDVAHFCIPNPDPALGFKVCVFQTGDSDCPSISAYSEKHVFYEDYEDTRACSDCTCGAPSGSACSAQVSVYTDGACSSLAYSTTATSAGPSCHDLPAGSALGSKSAAAPTYTPGTCTPGGGEPMGAATPITPGTYCCLPHLPSP